LSFLYLPAAAYLRPVKNTISTKKTNTDRNAAPTVLFFLWKQMRRSPSQSCKTTLLS